MNQNYYQDEVEIDLIQFCKRLLVQWRAVVAVALIFGILVMCGKYMMDVKNYKTAQATEDNYNIESAIENMDAGDYNAVLNAVTTQKRLDSWNDYMENSLYLKVDANSYEQIRLLYKIKTSGDSDVVSVISAYQESIYSEEILSKIATSTEITTDQKYLRDIISVESQRTDSKESSEDVMVVSAMVPTGVDSAELKKALLDAVASSQEIVEHYDYEYQMDLVSDAVEIVSDLQTLQDQRDMLNDFNMLKATQKTAINTFSDEQKKLYQAMLDGDGVNDVAEETSKESASDEVVASASMSKKYFAIGILLGIVLYVGLYFTWVLLNPYAVELAVAGATNMPVVGRIRMTNKKKGMFGFFVCDDIVCRWMYKDSDNLEKAGNIIGQMLVYAGSKEEKKFQILQPGFDMANETKIQELKLIAANQGIEVTTVSLDLTDIKESLSKIDVTIPSVLAIYETKTLKKYVRTLYEMLSNQKAKVIGELHVS